MILNVAVTQLLQMSHDSVMFSEASSDLKKRMYGLISPVPAVKAYGYYPNAWWPAMGLTQGDFSTSRAPNYFETRDSEVECDGLAPGQTAEQAAAAGKVSEGLINMGTALPSMSFPLPPSLSSPPPLFSFTMPC